MRRNDTFGTDVPGTGERGRAFRSPWLEQLDPLAPLHPLCGELETDIAIVGAGIAGIPPSPKGMMRLRPASRQRRSG